MSRATQVLTLLYPNGIPPAEYQAALAVAEIAQRAEATGAQLKMPESGEYRAVVQSIAPAPRKRGKPATLNAVLGITPGTVKEYEIWGGPGGGVLKPARVKRGTLDVKTVASQSKVTPQTVYAAIKKGALRAKKVKGEYRVRWADAEKWFGGVA